MANYAIAGLLSGAGDGLQKVAGMRYERERDEANHLRAKSMAQFQQKLSDESYSTRTADQRVHEAGLLDSQREREDAQRNSDITRVIDLDNGKQAGVNVSGEVVQEWSRPVTAAEATAQKAGDTKFDNTGGKHARDIVTEHFVTSTLTNILQQEGASLDQFMLKNQVTGEVEFSVPRLRAEFPELAARLDNEQQFAEEFVRKGYPPAQAAAAARQEVASMTDRQIKAEKDKRIKAAAEEYNISPEKVRTLMEMDPAAARKKAEKFNPRSQEDLADLELLNKLNPAAHDAIVAARANNTGGVSGGWGEETTKPSRGRVGDGYVPSDGYVPGLTTPTTTPETPKPSRPRERSHHRPGEGLID